MLYKLTRSDFDSAINDQPMEAELTDIEDAATGADDVEVQPNDQKTTVDDRKPITVLYCTKCLAIGREGGEASKACVDAPHNFVGVEEALTKEGDRIRAQLEVAHLKEIEEARRCKEETDKIEAKRAENLIKLENDEAARREKVRAEKEERLKAETEAKIIAEKSKRIQAEQEVLRLQAEEVKLKAEKERVRLEATAEIARLRAEEQKRLKAEEDAKFKDENEGPKPTFYCTKCLAKGSMGGDASKECPDPPHSFVPTAPPRKKKKVKKLLDEDMDAHNMPSPPSTQPAAEALPIEKTNVFCNCMV